MKNIIKLILKYHFTIIFILLEFISFSLMVEHNNYQRTVFFRHTASFFCYISSYVTDIQEYFSLKSANDKLVEENTNLKNRLEQLAAYREHYYLDSLEIQGDYIYYKAKIVNSSFNKTKNYLTLNRGNNDGIRSEMAVCSKDGVIGVVKNTSNHFSFIIPLINVNLRVSAKIKKNGYYGSLQWDGNDYRYSFLNDIPFHVNVEQGDTIVTSGHSSIFPEGELIGFVETVDRETANFLSIKVKLATDFKRQSDVYIVAYRNQEEQKQLEQEGKNE